MNLKIKEKKWHNEEIYSLKFEKPPNFNSKPGQFMTISIEVDGKIEKRAYSFSSSPTEDFLMFTIKKEKKVSKKLSELEEGDKLEAKGPFGIFTLDESPNNINFIAGGTGITPFRCMAKYIVDKHLSKKARLFYSARTENDLIFKDEFYTLSNNGNFKFFPTATRDENFKGRKGRIDEQFLKENIVSFSDGIFYVCGPQQFVDAIVEILKKLGANKNIKVDKWG